MNDTLKAIASRRSIRQYKAQQIEEADLLAILEAGLQAPSGHNDQSWYFLAIQDKNLIKEISDGSKLEMQKLPVDWMVSAGKNESYNIFYNAPTAIIVAARQDAIAPLADVCAAIQNMCIAAASLGIGSCWIGFAKFHFTSPEKYKKLGIPEGYEVHYGLTLGYKADGPEANPPQRKYERYYRIIKSIKAI